MMKRESGNSETSRRKEDHLDICLDGERYADPALSDNSLDQIKFVHQAIPELNSERIDTSQHFLRAKLSLPLMISCMTGGSDRGRDANHALACAAQQAGIAVGMGSIRPLLQDAETFPHFFIKAKAPDVPVVANLGAVQLRDLDGPILSQVLKRLEVQALAVHLNVGQELFQPRGDRDFRGILSAIERAVEESGVPVIVKETGFGLRPRLVRHLLSLGVDYVDLAGSDGTNWVMVEGQRMSGNSSERAMAFSDWGLPTGVLLSLLGDTGPKIIASGGLRHGVHLAKTVALGAVIGGMALPFIQAVMTKGAEGVGILIDQIKQELRIAMTLCAANSLSDLRQIPVMQSASFRHQANELRRADASSFINVPERKFPK